MAARGRGSAITTICPRCGAAGQVPGSICQNCRHHFAVLPEWAQPMRRNRWRSWPRLLAIVLLVVALGAVVWANYPFIPNPVVIIFKRPSTNVTSASLPGQWAMHGGDLQQTNYVPSYSHQPEGRLVRSLDLGASTRSAPAIVDGVIYIGGHFKIMAIDAETSQTIWELPTTGPVHSSPAVAGKLLYVGLLDKRIIALDRESGQIRWTFTTEDIVPGSAAVDYGMVYIGSRDSFLYALDAKMGELIWKFKTVGVPAASPPAIYNGKIFVSSSNGNLYVRSSRTGDTRLRFRTGASLLKSPVVGNGLVYFESSGDVFAVDADARELPGQYQLNLLWAQLWLWQFPVVPKPPGQPGGKWRLSPDGGGQSFRFAPALTPETLYIGDTQNLFYAVDALKGTKLWRFRADAPIAASAVVVGERVYFGTEDGLLYALDRFSGEPLWKLSLGAPLETQPVFSEGRLYARTSDQTLHFIE